MLCRGSRKPNFLKNIGVIPNHTAVPKLQLQFQFDSQEKRREELESIVDEYKKTKEHDDADKMKIKEELDHVIKYQESCNALIKQLLATHAASWKPLQTRGFLISLCEDFGALCES